ncbi:MAG: hypothetical protein KDA66_05150 [Planctomycetaceae bacterium]|nr:hypothetical protein [Planctomycetaceae bacterium]
MRNKSLTHLIHTLICGAMTCTICPADEPSPLDPDVGIVRLRDQFEGATPNLPASTDEPTPQEVNEPSEAAPGLVVPPSPNFVADDAEAHPLFLRDEVEANNSSGVPLFADRVPYVEGVGEAEAPWFAHWSEAAIEALSLPVEPLGFFTERVTWSEHDKPHTELEWHPIGIQTIPGRPDLLLETNEAFLDSGFLSQGVTMPTGAVWRPSIWVFGTYRAGYNYLRRPTGRDVSEITHRLDLFGQVNLSGTERILFGLRPFDEELASSRRFSSVDLHDGTTTDGLNAEVQTLFFEGDFGEIFPNLDPFDTMQLDLGFSVGRQPMLFQQGLLINEDRVDALTVTRNTVSGMGNLNLRMTGVYAWDEINRNNNQDDPNAQMFGLFTESDFRFSTVNADVAYVSSDSGLGSLFAFGLSAIQRIHGYENTYNTSFHVLGSIPTDGETTASGRGVLLFGQTSWTPHHTHDLVYLNGFWAIDQFTSPMRGTLGGGPLGQTGILFSAAGLGQFGAPLSNQASDVAGGSLGYQLFFNDTKQQVIFEIGGREPTNGGDAAFAMGSRFQRALNQHWLVLVDGFIAKQESQAWIPGTRIEFMAKF